MGLFGRFRRQPKATAFVGGSSRLGRQLLSRRSDGRNINALQIAGGEKLRAQVRQTTRENPYAASMAEAFVAAAVGTGIKPSSLIADPATKKAVQEAWLRWTDECDADGLTDFYGLQALAARACFEAGEVFIRLRPRRPEDGLSVPLQIQLLEAEHLPLNDNRKIGGNFVRAGIEFDPIGRRVAYYFLRNHPGEITTGLGLSSDETVRVPASEVLHLFRPIRPGQIRGQPWITPSMVRLSQLDAYDEAELERKKTAALFVGFIRPAKEGDAVLSVEGGQFGEAASLATGLPPDSGVAPMEPGGMNLLAPGDDISFAQPTEVGGSYEAFQYRNLTAVAAGAAVPYSSATGDLRQVSYSGLREGKLESRRKTEPFQHHVLVFQMGRPIWARWLEAAVLAGAVPISGRQFVENRAGLTAAKWIPPRLEAADPLKDRLANALAEDRGWVSRSDNMEAEGYDPEETDARIKADQERQKALGIVLGERAPIPWDAVTAALSGDERPAPAA